ncbi:MAG: DUF2079 domain-containing protein [bacterium]|nr:DUF2079 domain-containing protein [bacterium]
MPDPGWRAAARVVLKDKAFIFGALLYCTLLFVFQLLRVEVGTAGAWDLGIFAQVLWFSLHGKPFYYTVEPWWCGNLACSFLGVHFCPVLYLLLPLFALWPSAVMLIIIKIYVLLFLTLLILYYYCYLRTGDPRTAKLLAFLYALHPGVVGAALFDFHCEDFFPLGFFLVLTALELRCLWLFLLGYFLVLFSLEHFALYLALVLATIVLFSNRYKVRKHKLLIAGLFLLSGLLIFRAEIALMQMFRAKTTSKYFFSTAVRHISLENFFNNLAAKIYYFIELFLPFMFLPLLRPQLLLPVILWILFAFTYSLPTYYALATQYQDFTVPVIFFVFLETLEILEKKGTKIAKRSQLFIAGLILSAAFVIYVIRFQVPLNLSIGWRLFAVQEILHHVEPGKEPILVADSLFVFYACRNNSYAILPVVLGNRKLQELKLNWTVKLLHSTHYKYIIIDLYRLLQPRLKQLVLASINYSIYKPVIVLRNFIVLKKSKSCKPIIFEPINYYFSVTKLPGLKINRKNYSLLSFAPACNIYVPRLLLLRGKYVVLLELVRQKFRKKELAGEVVAASNHAVVFSWLHCTGSYCTALLRVARPGYYTLCLEAFTLLRASKLYVIYIWPCLVN